MTDRMSNTCERSLFAVGCSGCGVEMQQTSLCLKPIRGDVFGGGAEMRRIGRDRCISATRELPRLCTGQPQT